MRRSCLYCRISLFIFNNCCSHLSLVNIFEEPWLKEARTLLTGSSVNDLGHPLGLSTQSTDIWRVWCAFCCHEMALRYFSMLFSSPLRGLCPQSFPSFFSQRARALICARTRVFACLANCVPAVLARVRLHTWLFRSLLWNKLHCGWGAKWLISGTQIKIQLLQFEASQE